MQIENLSKYEVEANWRQQGLTADVTCNNIQNAKPLPLPAQQQQDGVL